MTRLEAGSFRTRVGAYGLAVRGEHVLLCQLSAHVPSAGMWTLPGGGVDYGEQPVEALVREIGEETDLVVLGTPELLHARSFVREGPYMGVQLIYAVTLEDGVPRVVDVGGSTLRSAWVPLAGVETMPVVDLVRVALNLRANRQNGA